MIKIISFIFLTFKLFATEIVLTHQGGAVRDFIAGDLLPVRLDIINPEGIEDRKAFFSFLEKRELGQFSIMSYRALSQEKNSFNLEVVLTEEVKKTSELLYVYASKRIPIRLRNLNYKFVGLEPKINILEFDISKRSYVLLWVALALTAVAGVWGGRWYLKRKNLKKEKEKRYHVQKIFDGLQSRDQFELLYKKRGVWESYVKKDLAQKFYITLNQCQYKEAWSKGEYDEVYQIVDEMKRGMDG